MRKKLTEFVQLQMGFIKESYHHSTSENISLSESFSYNHIKEKLKKKKTGKNRHTETMTAIRDLALVLKRQNAKKNKSFQRS